MMTCHSILVIGVTQNISVDTFLCPYFPFLTFYVLMKTLVTTNLFRRHVESFRGEGQAPNQYSILIVANGDGDDWKKME